MDALLHICVRCVIFATFASAETSRLLCTTTLDDRARNLMVCIKDNEEIYLSPPQHILKVAVSLSRNLISLHGHQLSPEFCTQMNMTSFLCFIHLPKSKRNEPVRIAFSLGDSMTSVSWLVHQNKPNIDQEQGDSADDGVRYVDRDSEESQQSKCNRDHVRYSLSSCSGSCPFTVSVHFHNCTEAHWRGRGLEEHRNYKLRLDDEDFEEQVDDDQVEEKARFFSELTKNQEIIFVAENHSLALQCIEPNADINLQDTENLDVYLPATAPVQKLGQYDKVTQSKDGNIQLWAVSRTLHVSRMTMKLYGSYVCKYAVKSEKESQGGSPSEVSLSETHKKFLVLPHWCDSQRLNWGEDCEFRCICSYRWKVPIHYLCNCKEIIKQLNADFLHLQFIVLIVLAILMVSIFLFFIYWKDRQHPDSDQGAVAGFIQFVSDAWVIQNTLPNSSISSHQSSNKTESKNSDWEGKGGDYVSKKKKTQKPSDRMDTASEVGYKIAKGGKSKATSKKKSKKGAKAKKNRDSPGSDHELMGESEDT